MTIDTGLLHLVPEELPDELAVFTEPLAAALEILTQVQISPAKNAAVLGDGRLALMVAQVLALELVRKKGTVILKSTYAGNLRINMSQVAVNEITIVGSRCGPFEPALKLLKEGKVVLPPIELHELSDFEEAFASRAFKAGFRIG